MFVDDSELVSRKIPCSARFCQLGVRQFYHPRVRVMEILRSLVRYSGISLWIFTCGTDTGAGSH